MSMCEKCMRRNELCAGLMAFEGVKDFKKERWTPMECVIID